MGRDEWMGACITVGPMAMAMALSSHIHASMGLFSYGMVLLGAGMFGIGLSELYRKVRKQGEQLEKVLTALERR